MNFEQLISMLNLLNNNKNNSEGKKLSSIDNNLIGKKVIIRTYSAGVHYGELIEKEGKEVILKNARRLYYWETLNKGISLSEVAIVGLTNRSKVCAAVNLIWLEAIEIIPCSENAIKNIEVQNDYKAQS